MIGTACKAMQEGTRSTSKDCSVDVTSSASGPVLYVIVCGSPAARGVPDFVRSAQAAGWRVCVIPTPMGKRFVDVGELETLTGFPVRTEYKQPCEPDVLPPPDTVVVAPATFNTVNKIAAGVTDTLAVGIICEALGYQRRVIVAPAMNRALASVGAYQRSVEKLASDGVQMVLTATTTPGGGPADDPHDPFPWSAVLAALDPVG